MVDPQPISQASTSIIIPSAGHSLPGAETSMLNRCLATLAQLEPLPKEVIVVVGDEFQGELPRQMNSLPVKVLHRGPGSFDFSRAVNCGLLASGGDLVLMLNDDIEAETTDWIGKMAAHLDDPTIGVVGATLLYPDRSIQHIGMEIEDAQPIHSFRGCQLSEAAAAGADTARDVIGVTGACLLIRRRDVLNVGGMSLEFPSSYGDIDLCLRLLRSGLRVVVEPAATLIHHESASRAPVIEPWEWERFIARWGEEANSWHLPVNSATGHNYDSPMTADLVDGGDGEQIGHEILRLRERALGAETRSQQLADRVANQDDRITELEERVDERNTLIEEWKDRVAERDTRVAERDARIAEQDARIAERDVRMAEKDAETAKKDARIAQLEAENLDLQNLLNRPAIIRLARRLARGPRRSERDE
ncbi:MAG: glycosyltransferase [Acidimicrobiia bacterium]|nr:glycosyltransferase [Acidimicrobiia bacterium]MYB74119.1 glycosyltransferase [Acidimicrobiia bacterium]MYI00234.1 glycosyltransferase [Acidimicrobiia bacterium]